jgi:hypothetical protein
MPRKNLMTEVHEAEENHSLHDQKAKENQEGSRVPQSPSRMHLQ